MTVSCVGNRGWVIKELCKNHNSKGSIFNSWLIEKLVCIHHWKTMGGYQGSFSKCDCILYEGECDNKLGAANMSPKYSCLV